MLDTEKKKVVEENEEEENTSSSNNENEFQELDNEIEKVVRGETSYEEDKNDLNKTDLNNSQNSYQIYSKLKNNIYMNNMYMNMNNNPSYNCSSMNNSMNQNPNIINNMNNSNNQQINNINNNFNGILPRGKICIGKMKSNDIPNDIPIIKIKTRVNCITISTINKN